MNKRPVTVEADQVCTAALVLEVSEVTVATKGMHDHTSESGQILILLAKETESSDFARRRAFGPKPRSTPMMP